MRKAALKATMMLREKTHGFTLMKRASIMRTCSSRPSATMMQEMSGQWPEGFSTIWKPLPFPPVPVRVPSSKARWKTA